MDSNPPNNVIASVGKDGSFLVRGNPNRPSRLSFKHQDSRGHVQAPVGQRKRKPTFFSRCFPCWSKATPVPAEPTTRPKSQQMPVAASNKRPPVLPPLSAEDKVAKRKTLVLDLDETLVHSSFKPVPNPDFIIPVDMDSAIHKVYVLKRPGVDEFLRQVGPLYETIIFTASLSKYANPLVDQLDIHKVVDGRLFREDCVFHAGNFVKDLSLLDRELTRTIIIDNAPSSYIFQPQNALPCESWFDDMSDHELLDFIPILQELAQVEDVTVGLSNILA